MSGECLPSRRLIARGSICTVDECSCGVLHVTLGAMTIRLQTEVVASIWETLGEALAELSAHRSTKPDAIVDALPRSRGSSEQPS